ncbi:hypothetical protein ALQ71_200023 [Pseudomonas coronafaciens pv. striafaciens]|nr:hypothetical protein ALQ71_200023 [Pseudomonas coronafaciens pv. striafaciens]
MLPLVKRGRTSLEPPTRRPGFFHRFSSSSRFFPCSYAPCREFAKRSEIRLTVWCQTNALRLREITVGEIATQ